MSNPAETVDMPARTGPLPQDWWTSNFHPDPPMWGSEPTNEPWVQVVNTPETSSGDGVVFDPQRPQQRGMIVKVIDVWTAFGDTQMATVDVPSGAGDGWPRQGVPAGDVEKFWVAASQSATRPSNSSWRWVQITKTPGFGPTIDGQSTERGRGILFQQRASGPVKQVGSVIVYQMAHDPSGMRASVSRLESVPTGVTADRKPVCTESLALYENRYSVSGWPEEHRNKRYLCGVPEPTKDYQYCGQGDRFSLPSLISNPDEDPPFPPAGQGTKRYCGKLVELPKGKWYAATFFDHAPSPKSFMWVRIIDVPPDYDGKHFGRGELYKRSRFGGSISRKEVLIAEIDPGASPRTRIVPNDNPWSAGE
jgi:hypothetical protein